MKLEKIICLANRKTRLQFNVMERSLRASGCDLPMLVIPYNDDIFDLPKNASWWEVKELSSWLAAQKAVPTMRKYQVFFESNYHYLDTDICVLKNPAKVVEPYSDFVSSCAYWHDPELPCTPEAIALYQRKSTTWAKSVFNTGQFACEKSLYNLASLQEMCLRPECRKTCLEFWPTEEPGINLLVFMAGVPITNLTLPPICMESSCPADYPADMDPNSYWQDANRKPYLLHFLGHTKYASHPINDILFSFMTREERAEWDADVEAFYEKQRKEAKSFKAALRRVKSVVKTLQSV